MRKTSKMIAWALAGALMTAAALSMAGCGQGGQQGGAGAGSSASDEPISVYSREDGSGTRSAFVELVGLEEEMDGKKVDMTTDAAAITNSTSVMMTSVASDPEAIGYISLGSLNDTVKAVDVDGAAATADNVKDGTYRLSRPFNIVTKDGLSALAEDFIAYVMSADGQAVVEEAGYVSMMTDPTPYAPAGQSGKVVVAGSSSVSPVMEKLAEAYEAANPGVTVEIQTSDSTTGVNMAADGTADIGMASRDLKDSEAGQGLQAQAIAQDGIAVIVSPASAVTALTTQQLKDIFSGDALTWAEVLG